MGSSSARARLPRGVRARALPLLAAALVAGCAHLGPPGESAADRPPPRSPGTAAPAPADTAPRQAGVAAGSAAGTDGAPQAPTRLDPSEEITSSELATIPEPVEAPARAAPEALKPRSVAPSTTTPGAAVWSVQVLATPERPLADRVAREAAERLGSIARVEKEGALYKVRLGAFATEAEAQGLRERAVEMGYPGAFRVKNTPSATDE
ncbi:MAG TPA: SPOR domain-containing protein [Acidobacteriota bacterium]|nr:SPOR domain-containing protein [Acidobacteriota bacterium]